MAEHYRVVSRCAPIVIESRPIEYRGHDRFLQVTPDTPGLSATTIALWHEYTRAWYESEGRGAPVELAFGLVRALREETSIPVEVLLDPSERDPATALGDRLGWDVMSQGGSIVKVVLWDRRQPETSRIPGNAEDEARFEVIAQSVIAQINEHGLLPTVGAAECIREAADEHRRWVEARGFGPRRWPYRVQAAVIVSKTPPLP